MDEFEQPDAAEAATYNQPQPVSQSQSEARPQLSTENVERHTQAQFEQNYANQQHNQQYNGRGGRRGRGRGIGNNHNHNRSNNNNVNNGQGNGPRQRNGDGGGIGSSMHAGPQFQPQQPKPKAGPAASPRADPANADDDAPAQPIERMDETIAPPSDAPTVPAQPRIQAVRGDRSKTGPAKPVRKTEAEISELMAKMKIKSSAAALAHEKTRKDQANYEKLEEQQQKLREEERLRRAEEREVAEEKRKAERQNVKQMDLERSRNAMRKMKAMQGREWDSEKTEADIVDRSRGNSSMYRKGANGAVAPSQPQKQEPMFEEQFPALGGGDESGDRSANTGKELFPGGSGGGSRGGRGGRGGANAPRGGGLGSSRYADAAMDKPATDKPATGRSANTDIRKEEAQAAEPKMDAVGPDAGKQEFEQLKMEAGHVASWADDAGKDEEW